MKTRRRLDSAGPGSVAWPKRPVPRRVEAPTSSVVRRIAIASALLAAACGPWQRVGAPAPSEPPTSQVAALFDPTIVYRRLGYVTGTGQIRFVGNARLLAGRSPDTALAVVALSMQNRYLTFQRSPEGFAAAYRVELAFRQGTLLAQQVVRDERVVVGTFFETQRAEESIIYQGFFPVPAGAYLLSIVVRDQNGPGVGRYEGPFTVPRLEAPAIATPLAVYRAAPRTDLGATPDIVANPRSTVDYGTDSLRFYVETYGLPAGSELVAAALDSLGQPVWTDSIRTDSAAALRPFVFAIAPSRLALGRHELQVGLAGGDVVARAPFLVAFSGQWIAANFDEMMSLLRYFTSADTLRALARTPPEQRAEAWRKFLHDTDPNPATPENEALDRYFARLLSANDQFRDEGVAGWLTDRGEVYITLGAPDQVIDPRPDFRGRGRYVEWTYDQHNLALYFVDDAGFGRLRLDPGSRSQFDQLVNRLRRSPR